MSNQNLINRGKIQLVDKVKTVQNILNAVNKQKSIVLNLEKFNKRKNDPEFLKACANHLNCEIVFKHI